MMQNDIEIVHATKENLGQILEIGREAISAGWTMSFLLPEIDKEDAYFVAAQLSSDILGFAVFREVGENGELLQIATRKDVRQGGVGSLLLEDVLLHARDKSLDKVFLEVRRSNAAAISLYEKFGFKTLRVREGYYDNPVEDALVMERINH
ncbi:MAG: ribosomal protein S18-alanine N-acetyltransferase [Oscillospiraceae bacterium]|nr:ribosomal protein S18-alanine N-acetyltransferase [Oscillospiraceae bacterium]MCL2279207.1 ribosomal protein S18-alanine N-acetyltransferase [Oscillospiraceae bacterium]